MRRQRLGSGPMGKLREKLKCMNLASPNIRGHYQTRCCSCHVCLRVAKSLEMGLIFTLLMETEARSLPVRLPSVLVEVVHKTKSLESFRNVRLKDWQDRTRWGVKVAARV